MTTVYKWVIEHYNELVADYGGQWVLICRDQVVFADKKFDVVYNKAQELKVNLDECLIERIDSGDTVFYGTNFYDSKNKA